VVVRADFSLRTLGSVGAWACLIVHRVILQLFPAMAFATVHMKLALFLILGDEVVGIPIGARYWLIVVIGRPSSEVLPVVGVVALASVVFDVVKGTPERFVMEDEKISVSLIVMNQLHSNLVLSMSKRAVHIVFTVAAIIRVVRTELGLILLETI